MGIHGLSKLLAENAPDCCREQKFDNYFGRKVAVDASMHIYQFMVVVGRVGDQLLQNEAGDVTSHLQGMFYRTTRMLEAGIKPVYVFDGKPPQLKSEQLMQRTTRRDDAKDSLKEASEAGDQEAVEKYSKRTVRVTKEHNDDCKRLLRLMGVPIIEAPSEAEAQCSSMARAGVVYGVATEDMDALTFGAPRVIRHLMAPSSSSTTIIEYDHAKVLSGLGLTEEQFVDLCILCGCDYASNIRGIGPIRALQLIRTHGNLDAAVKSLDATKYPLPEPYPYKEAKVFFQKPEVTAPADLPQLKWVAPDVEGLVTFLVGEKSFNEDRVRRAAEKIVASKSKASQGRLENFFGPVITKAGSSKPALPVAKTGDKRKGGPAPGAAAAKKGKLGVGGGKKK